MKKLLFSIFIATFFFVNSIFACQFAGKSIGKFDNTEYIFIGKVIGYTEPVKSDKLKENTYGLIVKVKESVYLPKTPKTQFEIFPIILWADCSIGGTQLDKLKKEFPVNTEVRVIAKESEIIPNNLTDGNIRLEERPNELSSIVVNFNKEGDRMTSSTSIFDYKTFKYDINENSTTKYLLPDFETRKDLLRLKNSKTQEEKNKILENLLNAPSCCGNLNFYDLLKTYAANETEFNRLYETRLKMDMSDEEFNKYKIIQETLAELVRQGYSKDAANTAIGKVVGEGENITKENLLKRTLEILKKHKK